MDRIFWVSVVFLLVGCESSESILSKKYMQLAGKTMGTTYHITYYDPDARLLKKEVDDLLKEVNEDLSTYIDTSFISRFNQSEGGIQLGASFGSSDSPNRHFLMNYYKAKQIHQLSAGHFDPTVMPLVEYWGFGLEKRPVQQIDSIRIDSLMHFVGYHLVELQEDAGFIAKKKTGVELDFSAIAKGYGVDAVCELFERIGVKDYFVEIGGEVRAKGKNAKDRTWTVGINTPLEDAGTADFQAVVQLPALAIATSGNYRNYYELDGIKYAHTIDPKSGFPKKTRLLSASVFAEDCMTADAVATACMVMGLDQAYEMIEREEGLEAYLIYGDPNGELKVKYSSGMEKLILR